MKKLTDMTTSELRAKYEEVIGKPTNSHDRKGLLRNIENAQQAAKEAAKPTRARDPRLPTPGTVLERKYQGKIVRATVMEDEVLYRGKKYRSLSAVAREATGTIWNGFLFFGLVTYHRPPKAAPAPSASASPEAATAETTAPAEAAQAPAPATETAPEAPTQA